MLFLSMFVNLCECNAVAFGLLALAQESPERADQP